jgi:drug/metabolite transporter (DMT)-like permease
MIILLALLIPVAALSLVTAQALWRSAVVSDQVFNRNGSIYTIIHQVLTSPKIWLGIILYIGTTGLYLFLLTKYKFFVIQLTVTGLALVFSTLIAYFIFHEKISLVNIIGLVVVLFGILLVVQK